MKRVTPYVVGVQIRPESHPNPGSWISDPAMPGGGMFGIMPPGAHEMAPLPPGLGEFDGFRWMGWE